MDQIIDNVQINFDTKSLWSLNIALAFVMFGVALDISVSDFKRLLKNPRPVLVGVVSQFLLLPTLTFILVFLLDPLPSMAMGMFMVAACPGGNISNFITHLAKGNAALSVTLTAIATMLAIVLTPLNLQFWGAMYEPTALILQKVSIAPLDMIKVVSLLLGLPLLLGMWVNHHRPLVAKKMSKFFKVGSLAFFVLLVFLALKNNANIFMEYVMYVFWLVLLHNLLAFLTGFSVARAFGLSKIDTRSITIETGIQNSGLGLLLIFTFFEGLGGMALLTAFWGIWHLVSGLILGGFWANRSSQKKEYS